MKNNHAAVGKNGKRNDGASKADVVGEALRSYLDGRNREAWRFAYGLCRDRQEADELLQEACYKALRESRSYDPSRPVKSWLFTIMRNSFMDARRRKSRRGTLSLDYSGPEGEASFHERIASDEEGQFERLERRELAALTRAALRRLKSGHQEALKLCDADGLSCKAAAKVLRVGTGALRSRLHRARRSFRASATRLGLG